MKKFFLALCYTVICAAVTVQAADPVKGKHAWKQDVIEVTTTSMAEGITMPAIRGQIVGLKYLPVGDYTVNVTNGKKFKKQRFSVMRCTVLDMTADVESVEIVETPVPTAVLSTAFLHEGKVHNILGYYKGVMAYPSEGYKMIIKKGRDVEYWNEMNCRIR